MNNHREHPLSPAAEIEAAAAMLESHADFRILRRVGDTANLVSPDIDEDEPTRVGIVIDTETTGLDVTNDVIIELAVQRFRFNRHGQITKVDVPHAWREDPGRPLSERVKQITGLTDEDLVGQEIDSSAATNLLNSANVIVAHNAKFDAPFVEARLPLIAGLPWACSLSDPDWAGLGFSGRNLSHLIMEAGWFFPPHRAAADIAALLHLLAHPIEGGTTVLAHLIGRAERQTIRLEATRSSFGLKDVLKARGYRWNQAASVWWVEIDACDLDAERLWLQRAGYFGQPLLKHVSWTERHR